MTKEKKNFSWFFRRATILAVVFSVLAAVSASASVSPERISIAYSSDSVPFHFTDENGKAAGIMIDLWRLWSEKTGIEVDFKAATWEETLKMVGSGAADAHAGLFYSKERDAYLDYSTTLEKTAAHYFSRKDLPPINTMKDLAKYKVGVIAGDYVEGYLKERLPEGNVVPYPDYETLMLALANGFLKVFAADTPTGVFHLKKIGLTSDYTFIREKPLYESDWFAAVQEGNKVLLKVIKQGMALISNKEKSEINRHWLGGSDEIGEGLIISIDRSYPPFTFVNAMGKPSGLFVEIWRAWAQQTGQNIQFRASDWSETFQNVMDGEANFHSGLSFSKEREDWVDLSSPIYEISTRVYHRVDDPQPANIEDYGTNPIGVLLGSHQETKFKDAYPHLWLRSYLTNEELVKALLQNEIKAVAVEEARIEAMLALMGLHGEIVSRPERLFPSPIHAGVSKENPDLLQEINQGLALILSSKLGCYRKTLDTRSGKAFL